MGLRLQQRFYEYGLEHLKLIFVDKTYVNPRYLPYLVDIYAGICLLCKILSTIQRLQADSAGFTELGER
jgi:hypothetical protein